MTAQPRLESILEHAPVGIFVLDRDYTVLAWNRCLETWTGVTAASIVGTRIAERFPNLSEPRIAARIQGVFAGGPPVVFSSQLHRFLIPVELRDGSMQTQQCVIRGIPSAQADRVDALVVVQDVTAQTRQAAAFRAMRDRAQAELESRIAAEAQMQEYTRSLEEANAELNLFASIVSHDLRAPLRRIVMLSEFVTPSATGEVGDFLGQIRQAAKRAHELVEDLSSYSRITCDRTPEDDVDLGTLVADVLADLASEIYEAHAVINVTPSVAVLPPLRGNATQLRQVIQNLIENALKYRSPGRIAKVIVEAHHDEREIVLSVEDNGIGIEPVFLEKVFEPFQRSNAAKALPGTGIGLAICKRVCQLHRGDLRVDSRVGEGSRFVVTLPLSHPSTATGHDTSSAA